MASVGTSSPTSVAGTGSAADRRETGFFLIMAALLGLTVATGFGLFLVIGISRFNSPWWVHVHAVSFMAFMALFVSQSYLVYRGRLSHHRALGRFGAVLCAWLVLIGLLIPSATVAAQRLPPFFSAAEFLSMSWVNVVIFAGLASAGIIQRRQTDWHRRLMLCATICVIAPAWGRILVLAGLMTPWHNVLALLGYVLLAAAFDLFNRGRIHPAYAWGTVALLVMGIATPLMAGLPAVVAYSERLSGG